MTYRTRRTKLILNLAAVGAAFAGIVTPARRLRAATFTWDAGGASPADPADGSGTWDTSTAEWSNGAADSAWNNGDGDTAVFGSSNGAGGTVTLGTAITAGSITFSAPGSASYVVGNTSANSLTITTGDVSVAPSVSAVITSPIDGANGLTLSGGGTLQLGGSVNAVAYTGNTTINNSTLQFNNLSPSAAVTVGNGTTDINFDGSSASLVSAISKSVQLYLDSNIVVAGGTTASISFSPRTYVGEGSSGGETTVTGSATSTLNLTADTTITRDLFYSSASGFNGAINIQPAAASGSPLIFEGLNGSFTSTSTGFFTGLPGTFNVNGEIGTANPSAGETYTVGALGGAGTGLIDTPTVGGTANWSVGSLGLSTTYAGAINGNNALTLTGGALTLTGSSTYTGATQVNGGVLFANGASTPTGTGSVTVAAGATFAGSGTISGAVTSSGAIAPGPASNTAGTLTVSNAATLNPSSILSYILSTPNVAGGTGGNSLLSVGALTLSTGITLDVTPQTGFGPGSYVLIDYSSLTDNSSSFSGWTVSGLASNESAQLTLVPNGGGGAVDLVVSNSGPQTLSWTDASADNLWNTASSNWTDGSTTAYSDGSNVIFNDSNGGNYSVTLNTAVSPGSVAVNNSNGNYVISGTGSIAGTTSLTKSGSGVLTLDTVNTYSGGTSVQEGTLVAAVHGALPSGAVNITGGALKLGANTGAATVASLTLSGNGTLDLTNNQLFINYGSNSDPVSAIYSYLKTGYNNGAWNGPGIISSTAQTLTSGLRYGVGWADGNDGTRNVSGLSSGEIELKYTLLGDANLDGTVNGSDFSVLAANFGLGVTNWDQGNFLYSSSVNGSDFSALAANFGQGDSGADAQVTQADIQALDAFAVANNLPIPTFAPVPEPATAGLLLAATTGALLRRRRPS